MIAIVDYGVGNLNSVQKALMHLGHESVITSDAQVLACAAGVVLPGVGAFGDAMDNLALRGLVSPLRALSQEGKPLLGICLGMQLLFTTSEEHGRHVGLGIIEGHVRRMRGDYKVPHVGWNELTIQSPHPLLEGVRTGDHAYFVHSYYVEPVNFAAVIATTDYFQDVPAAVAQGSVLGLQFHPEKSSRAGLRMLANFAALCEVEVSR